MSIRVAVKFLDTPSRNGIQYRKERAEEETDCEANMRPAHSMYRNYHFRVRRLQQFQFRTTTAAA
jgi:hypothetical protein